MLDANLQMFVEKVCEITKSHLVSPSDEAMLADNWCYIFEDFDGWVVLKVTTKAKDGYWMHPMLYPATDIDAAFKGNLHEFSIIPGSVAYSHVMSGDDHWIDPYWRSDRTFNNDEVPLYFERHYYGRPRGKEDYIEFNQLVTHTLGLNWSENKNAYCSVNSLGEEVEKILLIESKEVDLILIRRRTLDKLLYLGKWVLVRYFQFSRWLTKNPPFSVCRPKVVTASEFYGRYEIRTFGIGKIEFAEFRGVQVERPVTPKDEVLTFFADEEEGNKKYAAFTVYDWKNQKILENYSINPANFSNYFTESTLPFETSPVFFKAEVLDKYRYNPDKYELNERTITCRGGWHLESFDINEHNQVHTYAIYLSRLPYKEQLYWLPFNEKPNGGISKRAMQTDFEGRFPDKESKIEKLREELEKLGNIKINDDIGAIWVPKGGDWDLASKGLYYPKTENANQWHDYNIALANTVIEGFQTTVLKRIAQYYGNEDKNLKSLGLIKFIISSTGNEQYLPQTHEALRDLQSKRSAGKAHGAWDIPAGSLIEDAERRLDSLITAVEVLGLVFSKLELSDKQV